MDELTVLQRVAIWAIPVLFAITLHEWAHGWVARQLGDPTAALEGRLTLNPIKHIDPVGTLLVPGVLLFLGGFVFGWAKPVPVDWQNLRDPRRDMAWVAIAGPTANLIMAMLWAAVMKVGMILSQDAAWIGLPLIYMGGAGIFINIILMVLNMLPLPPLDGGRILAAFVPARWTGYLDAVEPYGIIILLALLLTGVLAAVMGPAVFAVESIIYSLAGL